MDKHGLKVIKPCAQYKQPSCVIRLHLSKHIPSFESLDIIIMKYIDEDCRHRCAHTYRTVTIFYRSLIFCYGFRLFVLQVPITIKKKDK